MSRPQELSTVECVKLLVKAGYIETRDTGKHTVYKNGVNSFALPRARMQSPAITRQLLKLQTV